MSNKRNCIYFWLHESRKLKSASFTSSQGFRLLIEVDWLMICVINIWLYLLIWFTFNYIHPLEENMVCINGRMQRHLVVGLVSCKVVSPIPSNTWSARTFHRDTVRGKKVQRYCKVLKRGIELLYRYATRATRVTRTSTYGPSRAP